MSTPSSRPILYSGPLSMFGAKVEIAALEKRLDVELVMVPYESSAGYSPKHPEIVRIGPKQQVPVLVHGDLELFGAAVHGRAGRWRRRAVTRAAAPTIAGRHGMVTRRGASSG